MPDGSSHQSTGRAGADRWWRAVASWSVLAVSLGLVWFAWQAMRTRSIEYYEHQLSTQTLGLRNGLERRMAEQAQTLRAAAVLVEALGLPDAARWRALHQRLRLGEPVPGLRGVGFCPVAVAGPSTPGSVDAPGCGLFSEPLRAEALRRADESGEVILSSKVLVQQAGREPQAGFLLVMATHDPALEPAADQARRGSLRGFVFSEFNAEDVAKAAMGERRSDLEVSLFDGVDVSVSSLLFSSVPGQVVEPGLTPHELPMLADLKLFGRSWTVTFRPKARFAERYDGRVELPVLLLGVSSCLALFALVRTLANRREAAVRLARELRESTAFILDSAIDGIFTIDDRGLVRSWNKACERLFGRSAAQMLGQSLQPLLADGSPPQVTPSGRPAERLGKRSDGTTFPLEFSCSEVARDGHPVLIGLVRDITERKRYEQMKDEFVSTISHELRTPLTAIGGALGLAIGGALGPLPEKAQRLLKIALSNCERLGALINDLLDLDAIAAGKFRLDLGVHPLQPLVERAVEANRPYAERFRVSLSLTSGPPVGAVRVDPSRLLQVLANLISNAAKFSHQGGAVGVSVAVRGQRARVEVADHGQGMPLEFQPRVFQKFSQADSSDVRKKGGTGLGLSIVKELVERMGGEVGFTSTLGVGTVFFVEFPNLDLADERPPQRLGAAG